MAQPDIINTTHKNRRELVKRLAALPLALATPAWAADKTQTIIDQTGQTVRMPKRPQRVVSMADMVFTVPLYELGVSIFASARTIDKVHAFETLFGRTPEDAGILDAGQSEAFDMETIAALQPDLILADTSFSQTDGLSQIAPVYLTNYFFGGQSRLGIPRDLAQAFGVEGRFSDLENAYQTRIARLRDRIGTREAPLTWCAAMVSNGEFMLGRNGGAFAVVARDLGLVAPDWLSDISTPDAFFPMSLESLPQVDADLVMMMPPYFQDDQSPAATKRTMTTLMPGWERFIPAAQKGAIVYVSGETAIVPAFAAAHRVLNSLEAQWSVIKQAAE